MRAAAFFDLDKTLIRRSSTLALAPAFRRHGVITRMQVAKAAFWQLLFVLRGTTVEFVPVKTGIAGEKYFEVLSGLKEGDQVVTGPFNSVRNLADGDDVKVVTTPTRTNK